MGKIYKNGILFAGSTENARSVAFDNTDTRIEADNVQGAIEEIDNNIVEINSNLATTNQNLNNTNQNVSKCALRWVEEKYGANNTINLGVSNNLDLYVFTSDSVGKETYAIILVTRVTNTTGKLIPLYDQWSTYGAGTYSLIGLGLNVKSAYGFFVRHYTFIK